MNICKGHVYIIFCHVNPKIYYVGSTFNQLKQRWNKHKNSNNDCSIKKYFDKYGIENFSIKLIKSYNVYREHSKDNKHLRAYEQLWINKFRNSCNIFHSFNPLKKEQKTRTNKEWYENNKKKNIEIKKEYYKNNKEKILEKAKEKYTKNNKEQIKKKSKEYYENNKKNILENQKEYRENNKEKILEKCKEYRENNKEQIKKKYTCECGSILTIQKKSRHLKSIKHQNYIKNNI